MNKITIENAKVEDVPQMCKWGRENWQIWASDSCKFFSENDLASWIKNPREDMLLVARVDGKLAGMCLVTMMRGWVYCDGYYIDTPFRRMGLGRAIMDEIENKCRQKKIELIGLFSNLKNTPSHEFYQKIGFNPGYKFIWMEKRLKTNNK